MRAAQACAAVTPGTTSTPMPAVCRAAISSAARPKMKGSPPLSRATTLPAEASRTRMRLISACEVVGPPGVLPTKMRSASRRAYSRIFGIDQTVDDQHVGLLQALQGL